MKRMSLANLTIPAYNGVTLGFGPEAAGVSNVLAHIAANNTQAARDYAQGKREYKEQLEQARGEYPGVSFILEMGGGLLSGGVIAKLISKGLGVASALKNSWQINRGAKKLENVLRTQQFTEEPIKAGKLPAGRREAINEILRKQGGTELADDTVLWDKTGQNHLFHRRIKHDKADPADVAQWQKELFFGKDSKPYINSRIRSNTGPLQTVHKQGYIRGFLENDGKGKTMGRSVFLRKKKR